MDGHQHCAKCQAALGVSVTCRMPFASCGSGHISTPLCFAELRTLTSSVAPHLQNTNLEDVVGTNLGVKFLEADPETGRMVFSARRAQIFKQIGALSVSCWATLELGMLPHLTSAALPGH